MERVPYAISQSNVDKGKSLVNSKRELSWTFGWTNSRTTHVVLFKYDDISGKKVISLDGKDVYNEINTNSGLSFSWETRKGHLFHIESFDNNVIFSIDETPFDEFMFPRPVRTKSEEEALENSDSDDEGGDSDDDNKSVLSKYTSYTTVGENGSIVQKGSTPRYIFDIEVINPTVQKNENYIVYTINTCCDDPSLPQLERVSVSRRYNDFVFLHKKLCDHKDYRGLIIPPIPAKQTLGRFEPSFLEERRAALCLFLTRLRDHNTFCDCPFFHSFLYESEDQLLLQKNTFFSERDSALRTSISDWFGSAMHSLATTVGKYEEVGLGFNPLDMQVDEIERYTEPLYEAMARVDRCTRQLVATRYKSQQVLSEWGRVVCLLGEMPAGPSTLGVDQGISLSQILELEPEPKNDDESDEIEEVNKIENKNDDDVTKEEEEEEEEDTHYLHQSFPSDLSDLTASEYPSSVEKTSVYSTLLTHNSRPTGATKSSSLMEWAGWGGGKGTEQVQPLSPRAELETEVETMTTVAERECSSYLILLGCSAESTAQLQKDLAHAHEVEICRCLDEYSRLLQSLKKTLKTRKDAKKVFTDSIAVKMEKYQQYNASIEALADSNKVAVKLQAYNEAKRIMLDNRQTHVTISKNLIADFDRFMREKDRDMKKLATDVLTFNLLNCQDNIENWSNTQATFNHDIDGVN